MGNTSRWKMTSRGQNKWTKWDNRSHKLTGSILRASQPFPLRVALDTDDVQAFSLLQSKVGLTAFAVHTSFHLVNSLQGADQLTSREEIKIVPFIHRFVWTETKNTEQTKCVQSFLHAQLSGPVSFAHFEFLPGILLLLLPFLLLLLLSLQSFFLLLHLVLFLSSCFPFECESRGGYKLWAIDR